jgi:IclR family acetate operon transcriptional repressor
VIEAVVAAGEPVGPRALARLTGIDRSAVGRILQRLAALGMLTAEDGCYSPGQRLFAVARVLSALDTLPVAATAALSSLVDKFDETSYVCTWHGDSAVFLYEGQSSKPLRYVIELGRPVPLHAGAGGRAILAGLPEETVRELLGTDPLAALTPFTVSDVDALLELCAADRERGYSISRQERVEGGFAIAAPFFDRRDRCQGSVVLSGPLSRLGDYDVDEVGRAVRHAADSLSARLGASTVDPKI